MIRYRRKFAAFITNQFQSPNILKANSVQNSQIIACKLTFKQNYVTKIDEHVATYEEIAKSVNKPNKIIVDVRNQDEIKTTGQIPSSINIPVNNIQEVLESMSETEFQRKYHRPKPSQSDELIFYCKSGKRATEATNVALKLGYSKSKKYLPGWDGWNEKK
ncbi:rhodanese domain-containing protein CG4456-like isoform X2 [Pieris rapae]|uniref:rhodanese domain-containing protein CG4456-like isoform X2 n=1 Tax=Pieris rapae TaxID=64459 RepID=UPI001E27F06E|nr:rhodanese domain-containing protein CG4456-like isoform X2 [Pieris rapae]